LHHLLLSDHIHRDAVHDNRIMQSSVYRANCKYLTNSKNRVGMVYLHGVSKPTRNIVSYATSFQRQALYRHFLHGVAQGFKGFQHEGFGGCVFFITSGKQGQVERDSFCVVCLSLFYRNSNAYLGTFGTSQTNTALVFGCM
jgi:hypothetical protein